MIECHLSLSRHPSACMNQPDFTPSAVLHSNVRVETNDRTKQIVEDNDTWAKAIVHVG